MLARHHLSRWPSSGIRTCWHRNWRRLRLIWHPTHRCQTATPDQSHSMANSCFQRCLQQRQGASWLPISSLETVAGLGSRLHAWQPRRQIYTTTATAAGSTSPAGRAGKNTNGCWNARSRQIPGQCFIAAPMGSQGSPSPFEHRNADSPTHLPVSYTHLTLPTKRIV